MEEVEKNSGAVRDIKSSLTEADWDELLPKLIGYARLRMKGLTWRGSYNGEVPGGWEAEDFVREAVRKALDGTRNWPEKQTLLDFLKGIISSEVSQRVEAYENVHGRRATTNAAEVDSATIDISGIADDFRQSATVAVEWTERRALILAQLDDSIDRDIVTLIIDEGLDRPQEIAERLGIPIEAVYNARKRLRRKDFLFEAKATALRSDGVSV